jgi:hypothetical protein
MTPFSSRANICVLIACLLCLFHLAFCFAVDFVFGVGARLIAHRRRDDLVTKYEHNKDGDLITIKKRGSAKQGEKRPNTRNKNQVHGNS